MLQGNFYSVISNESPSPENHRFQLAIDPSHAIFDGHFPGQPVVPGVCLVQMGKEMLENIVERKLFLEKGSTIKFLNVVDPQITAKIQLDIKIKSNQPEAISTDFSISFESTTFVKFSGQFR